MFVLLRVGKYRPGPLCSLGPSSLQGNCLRGCGGYRYRQLKSLRRLSSGLAAASAASGLGGRDKGRRGALEELSKPEEPKAEVKEREPLPRSRSRSSTS